MVHVEEEPAVMEVAELRDVLKSALTFKEDGNSAFKRGEYYLALELYNQAFKRLETLGETEEDKKSGLKATLHCNCSQAAMKIENYKLAAVHARDCLAIDPSHAKAQRVMQELAPNMLESKRAAKANPREEEEGPSTRNLVEGLIRTKDEGNAALQAGKTEEAIRLYTKALKRLEEIEHDMNDGNGDHSANTMRATLFSNRAKAYLDHEAFYKAFSDAKACLEVEPENQKAAHRLELAQAGITRMKERETQGDALKNAMRHKAEGNRCLQESDPHGALKAYASGLEWVDDLRASNQSAHDIYVALNSNSAQAALRMKDWKRAAEAADNVLEVDPKHVKALFRKGKALLELREFDEAEQVLQQARNFDPSNEDVVQELARLPELRNSPAPEPEMKQEQKKEKKEKKEPTPREDHMLMDDQAPEFMNESQAYYKQGDAKKGAELAGAAVSLLEMRGGLEGRVLKLTPEREDAKKLLAAYNQQVKCLLVARLWRDAIEIAERALKYRRWVDEHVWEKDPNWRPEWCQPEWNQLKLRGVQALEQHFEAIILNCQRLAAIQTASATERLHDHVIALTTEALEQLGGSWPGATQLRAGFYAARAHAALSTGDLAAADEDHAIAVSLDPGCFLAAFGIPWNHLHAQCLDALQKSQENESVGTSEEEKSVLEEEDPFENIREME